MLCIVLHPACMACGWPGFVEKGSMCAVLKEVVTDASLMSEVEEESGVLGKG